MGKEIDIVKLGEAWLQEDPLHRDLLIIARDGMLISSGVSCGAKSIANLLLNTMSKNAKLCEGVKLAAKHYDTVAEALRKDNEAKPAGKKVLS